MAKWIKALFLAACLLALCVGAVSAETVTRDGVEYLVEQNVARIVGFLENADLVRIPATLEGRPVELQFREDWGRHIAKKLIIEAGSIDIKENSLQYWEVEELVFEEGVTSIGERAFTSCTIGKLSLPGTLREIGPYAFAYCSGPAELIIPEGVVSIGESAFSNSNIETIALPSTVRSLGEGAVTGNYYLREITVSEENPSYCIRSGALYTKDGKTLLCFPSGAEKEWILPDGTTAIAQDGLQSPNLEILRIGEGLEVLEYGMLSCYQLRELYLPASLQKIEENAITDLPLQKIALSQDSAYFESDGSALYQKENRELVYFFNNDAKSYDIKPGTTRIHPAAFTRKSNLESVTVPRGIRVIEARTFNSCESLSVVQLPITLEEIEESAFGTCFMLERIVLPVNLKRIAGWAFSNCQSLTALYIPESVETIEEYAFSDCPELTLTAKAGTQGAIYARQHNAMKKANELQTRYGIIANDNKDTPLNLRSEPNSNSNVIQTYKNGTTVRILSEKEGWFHAAIGETEGYLDSRYVQEITGRFQIFQPYSGTMRKTLAVLRHPLEGSGSDFSVSAGSSVDILAVAGCFYHIEENGVSGFVLTTDVEVDIPANFGIRLGFVANPDYRDRLNLRASPSANVDSIDRFYNGTQVEILSEQGEWYQVRVGEWIGEGYMMKKFIEAK